MFIIIAVFAVGLHTYAQQNNRHQKARVAKGIKNGEITKKEAAKIHEERKEVKQEVKQANADGVVTVVERKEIKEERKEADKVIRRAKHNNKIRK